jgi:peptidoglycan/LPS O-acetylase OafA/YrhL
VTRYIGLLSYSIYLWHAWAFALTRELPAPVVVRIGAGVVLSVSLATASYYVIEKPFLTLKARFEARRSVYSALSVAPPAVDVS